MITPVCLFIYPLSHIITCLSSLFQEVYYYMLIIKINPENCMSVPPATPSTGNSIPERFALHFVFKNYWFHIETPVLKSITFSIQ